MENVTEARKHCEIAGEDCVLAGEEWSEDSSDVMWDLAHYVTGEQKRLWAKVSGCHTLPFCLTSFSENEGNRKDHSVHMGRVK